MAINKAVDGAQLDADLTTVADAIRTKAGTAASLSFPAGMAAAIAAIPGLPEFFTKMDWGTITPTENFPTSSGSQNRIYHTLGKKAKGFFLYDSSLQSPPSANEYTSAMFACFRFIVPTAPVNFGPPTIVYGANSSGKIVNYTSASELYANYIYIGNSYCNPWEVSTSLKLQAGHTYNWFVWA